MENYTDASCDECDEALLQVDGDWYCPACDSLSGFTLVPDDDEFAL